MLRQFPLLLLISCVVGGEQGQGQSADPRSPPPPLSDGATTLRLRTLPVSTAYDTRWELAGDPLYFDAHPAFKQWRAAAWTKDYFLESVLGNFTNTYVSANRYFPYFDPTSISDDFISRNSFTPPFHMEDIEKADIFDNFDELYKL
jgi:hypothetical protein